MWAGLVARLSAVDTGRTTRTTDTTHRGTRRRRRRGGRYGTGEGDSKQGQGKRAGHGLSSRRGAQKENAHQARGRAGVLPHQFGSDAPRKSTPLGGGPPKGSGHCSRRARPYLARGTLGERGEPERVSLAALTAYISARKPCQVIGGTRTLFAVVTAPRLVSSTSTTSARRDSNPQPAPGEARYALPLDDERESTLPRGTGTVKQREARESNPARR